MAKVVVLGKGGEKEITALFTNFVDNTRQFFEILGTQIDKDTQAQFRTEGARPRGDGDKWKPFSPLTLYPSWKAKVSSYPSYKGSRYNPQKSRKRKGTDGSRTRRYDASSKLMQASGGFRRSFRILEVSDDKLRYGSNLDKAKKIISGGGVNRREVVVFSKADGAYYQNLYYKWLLKKKKEI